MNSTNTPHTDVIIIGGGVAGLTAATYLGRAGHQLLLFDKAKQIGGRARTQAKGAYLFNMGAHALYRKGHGEQVLRELGVPFSGGMPNVGGYVVNERQKYKFPAGILSLISTKALTWRAKFELAKLLATIARVDTDAIRHLSVNQWLDQQISQPDAQALLRALFRLGTYANEPSRQSAGSAIAQLQMALADNVYYLDGGWQTIVDGLQKVAEAANVTIKTSHSVAQIQTDDHSNAVTVTLTNGSTYSASAIIIATGPTIAANLLPHVASIQQAAANATPVKAACLDLALKQLPDLASTFALGLDEPLYLSVHSAVAKLAPPNAAIVHLLKYLGPAGSNPKQDLAQLEAFADLIQPGWRQQLVEKRFLPNMLVSHALVTTTGLTARPTPTIPTHPNLFLAGDWVGPQGLLADAAFASAKETAAWCDAYLNK